MDIDALRQLIERGPRGPFRIYPNPMRADGVFVGRDLPPPTEPSSYGLDGPRYDPWVPGAIITPSQVPHATAALIVGALNALPGLLDEVEALRSAATTPGAETGREGQG